MTEQYIIGVDQSTQGTKAMLFDGRGRMIKRIDLPHQQIINDKGWVEHDPSEIYRNTVSLLQDLIRQTNVLPEEIAGLGISNQRETALAWDRETGEPVYNAIVWQCARGAEICSRIRSAGHGPMIQAHTGIQLSPYFSAAKLAWILENVPEAREKAKKGTLYCGTVDSWLVFRLTKGASFKTDYSNASRTQLFNISELAWDRQVCDLFGIPVSCLAEVCDSNSCFGTTDLEGFLPHPIPIHGVLGDSHGALFGQGCLERGMIKSTYGTGSSVMMNIGPQPVFSDKGVVTSIAWGMDGKVDYVLEGNINYTGAVISWIQKDLKLIDSPKETADLARSANPEDKTYLVPAFSGLGAPYWDSGATGVICGITRTTGQAELVKAALECIAYQITDIVTLMGEESGAGIREIRVDGGPTKNEYLMQFQSDLLGIPVQVPEAEELSGIGAAYAAGIALGVYDRSEIFDGMARSAYSPAMDPAVRAEKYAGWKQAVEKALSR